MKYIREITKALGYGYQIYIDDEKIQDIFVSRISKNHNNYRYMFLLDSNGKVIEDTFRYLNNYCRNESANSREQSVSALKFFYSFLEIKQKSIEKLDLEDVKNLSDFMLGINVEGMTESYELKTSRSITTHNLYFDAIRKYVKAIGENNKHLFSKISVNVQNGGFGMLGHTRTFTVSKHKTNKSRHSIFEGYVPKYISIDEYKKIMMYIDKSNDEYEYRLRAKIIVNLMYTRGMRLGEVLGLTIEDLKIHPDNPDAGVLIIRNRVSDSKYQQAKGCLKVTSKSTYQTRAYKEKNVGYQEIIMPPQLMKQINEYIDLSRDALNMTEKKLVNIYRNSLSDSVENDCQKNYYLFLNKYGSPLSSSGWNKVMKNIFKVVGIKLDKGNKRDNLNHRFRHGFAMYLIEIEKKEITYVQREMRHKSIQSTLRYYNPKPEDILQNVQAIQEKIKKNLEKGVTENDREDK